MHLWYTCVYTVKPLSINCTSRPLKVKVHYNSGLGRSLCQGVPHDHHYYDQGAHYIRVFTTSGCSLYQGVHYIRVFTISGGSLYQGAHYIRVLTTSGCSLHQGAHYIGVFARSGCSLHQGVHYIRVFTTSKAHAI